MKEIIAFFDFDGTVSKSDSLADFCKYALGNLNYYKGLLFLSPTLLAYKLKIIPNHVAKEKLISHFFKGWDEALFKSFTLKYSNEEINKIIKVDALDKIKWHHSNGHKVVIISASMESWLEGWCDKNNLELIATKLEIKNNKLTGKFSTKNCYGIEKVNRIKEHYKLEDYGVIYAYGNSNGDREMLDIAHIKNWW